MYQLENPLRPYPWGSATAIAELFGRRPSGGPEAELWLGAHPDSPSTALLPNGASCPLDELIAADPHRMLGAGARAAFGDRLPFLAKVLAAAAPLSLQVHPTSAQARTGYEREEAAGVARDASERNYKDANSKPEMIFALSDFDALCGFRAPEDAAAVLSAARDALEEGVPRGGASDNSDGGSVNGGSSGDGVSAAAAMLTELIELLEGPQSESERLQQAFERLITGGDEVREATAAVVGALATRPPHAFVRELGTAVALQNAYPGDPGALICLLLNHVSLQAGEALYLPAGNVHAYLRGLGVEVMGSSDNVLRGGLTSKHVDVPELMRTVDFAALEIPRQPAEHTGLDQELYRPPFTEFQLQRIEIPESSESMAAADIPVEQNGPTIVLVVRGAIVLDSPKGDLRLDTGGSAFIPASEAPVMAKVVRGEGSGPTGAVAFAVTVSTRAG